MILWLKSKPAPSMVTCQCFAHHHRSGFCVRERCKKTLQAQVCQSGQLPKLSKIHLLEYPKRDLIGQDSVLLSITHLSCRPNASQPALWQVPHHPTALKISAGGKKVLFLTSVFFWGELAGISAVFCLIRPKRNLLQPDGSCSLTYR